MNPDAKNESSTAPASTWTPTGALEALKPKLMSIPEAEVVRPLEEAGNAALRVRTAARAAADRGVISAERLTQIEMLSDAVGAAQRAHLMIPLPDGLDSGLAGNADTNMNVVEAQVMTLVRRGVLTGELPKAQGATLCDRAQRAEALMQLLIEKGLQGGMRVEHILRDMRLVQRFGQDEPASAVARTDLRDRAYTALVVAEQELGGPAWNHPITD